MVRAVLWICHLAGSLLIHDHRQLDFVVLQQVFEDAGNFIIFEGVDFGKPQLRRLLFLRPLLPMRLGLLWRSLLLLLLRLQLKSLVSINGISMSFTFSFLVEVLFRGICCRLASLRLLSSEESLSLLSSDFQILPCLGWCCAHCFQHVQRKVVVAGLEDEFLGDQVPTIHRFVPEPFDEGVD